MLRSVLSLIVLVAPFTAAIADDTVCTGLLDGVHDNVIVPEGADCVLTDALVRGTVEVKAHGSLAVRGRTSIQGSVQSDGGRHVRLLGGSVTVGGNVQIKRASNSSGYEPGTRIAGNFQFEENTGALFATGGLIGGNLQVIKNSGGGSISGNTIRETLQCKENFPPPAGGGNSVGGNKEDQCSPL
jgi:hypothetical protein